MRKLAGKMRSPATRDALNVQAGVVGNLDGTRSSIDALGRVQPGRKRRVASDAGGQSAHSPACVQISDLTALLAAQGRAASLDGATDRRQPRSGARAAFPVPLEGAPGLSAGDLTFH